MRAKPSRCRATPGSGCGAACEPVGVELLEPLTRALVAATAVLRGDAPALLGELAPDVVNPCSRTRASVALLLALAPRRAHRRTSSGAALRRFQPPRRALRSPARATIAAFSAARAARGVRGALDAEHLLLLAVELRDDPVEAPCAAPRVPQRFAQPGRPVRAPAASPRRPHLSLAHGGVAGVLAQLEPAEHGERGFPVPCRGLFEFGSESLAAVSLSGRLARRAGGSSVSAVWCRPSARPRTPRS